MTEVTQQQQDSFEEVVTPELGFEERGGVN